MRAVGPIADAIIFAGSVLNDPLPGGTLWECASCTFSFRYPRLDKATLDRLYAAGSDTVWHGPASQREDWKAAANVLSKNPAGGDALDIGCFDGRFLSMLGSQWRRQGVEINPLAIERAQASNILIIGQDFSALQGIVAAFDAITNFDVVEHVENPLGFLAACANALRPDGVLVVATGNSKSLPWRLLGSRNLYCTCAEHISFINPEWCVRVAPAAGLSVESVIRYRRAEPRLTRWLGDLSKNILFALMPGLIRRLRAQGVGNARHAVTAGYPPQWPTAKDHFLVVFRKAS